MKVKKIKRDEQHEGSDQLTDESWLVGNSTANAAKKEAKGLRQQKKGSKKDASALTVSARGTMFRGIGDNNISMRQKATDKGQAGGGVTSTQTSIFRWDLVLFDWLILLCRSCF